MTLKTQPNSTATLNPTLRPTLNINETASALGCSRSHIYKEIRSGHLRARHSRGRTVVLASDFQIYLNSLPPLAVRAS